MAILPPALVRGGGAGRLPVRVIAKTGTDQYRMWNLALHELAEFLGELATDELLTLVFGPVIVRNMAEVHAFTANGLAG
jgi:hypothetical protein